MIKIIIIIIINLFSLSSFATDIPTVSQGDQISAEQYNALVEKLNNLSKKIIVSTEWQDYPSVAVGSLVVGVSSNPAYGTVLHNEAKWRRVGERMEIEWNYSQGIGAGLMGTGAYLVKLPPGYQIDTSKAPSVANSTNDGFIVGDLRGTYSSGATFAGSALVYSNTALKFSVFAVNGGSVGSATLWGPYIGFNNVDFSFKITISVPIVGWTNYHTDL